MTTTNSSILRRIRRARVRRDEATAAIQQLVREAFEAGHSGREIAEAAGVSTPRVYQIRDGRR